MKQMSLRDWIDEVTPSKIAKELKCTRANVTQWRLGYQLPRAVQMFAINKMSKGAVTYEEMIDSYFKSTLNRRKYTTK